MSAVRNYYESNYYESNYENDYVEGNTVRKLRPVETPDRNRRRQEQREEYNRRQQREEQQRRSRLQRSRGIDKITLLFFTAALGFTIYMAIGYLQAQSTVRTMENEITSMKKEVLNLQNENDVIADNLPTLDLTKVYKIASTKLGMVLPKDNQVITYDSIKPNFVQQYTDVPESGNTAK